MLTDISIDIGACRLQNTRGFLEAASFVTTAAWDVSPWAVNGAVLTPVDAVLTSSLGVNLSTCLRHRVVVFPKFLLAVPRFQRAPGSEPQLTSDCTRAAFRGRVVCTRLGCGFPGP